MRSAAFSSPPIPEKQAWKALSALCVGLFITLLDQSLVVVALPRITEDLGASVNQAVWVSAVYLLTFAVPLLVTGRLGDRFGQRNMYLAGMALFTLAAAACAFAPTIEALILARAVQGFGGSLLNPQSLSVINRVFARHRRGAAMGVWSAVAGSAGLFGPVIGGLLAGGVGWRWVFLLYLPLGLVALALVARWVPRLPTGVGRIDLLSAVVSLVAVLGIVFTLQQGPELGWPLWLWGVLAVGVLALVLFVRLQRRADLRGAEALVPLRLFRIRNFRFGSLSVATLGFAVYSVNLPIMLYLQLGAGLSAQAAGLLLLPTAIVSVALAPVVGRLTDRLEPGRISKIGFTSMITAMVLYVVFISQELPFVWLIIPLMLMGAANAMCWSANSTISMRQLPAELLGAGSGVYNTSRQVGAVLGAAALGAAMQIGLQYTDFANAMGFSLILHIAVLVLGLVMVSNFSDDRPEVAPRTSG
ncbi:DHA2 family efflux MFS transporter permease subunit [Nocardiopsis sp. ATB16-24]|uniref:DHA2 family efflux MFS transporter permease subunit n=1 Tax=Nocardiopsis sp. ATB16-24 TaxID=3019555 RepID=UPI002553BB1C|nr:DHA2 family efflux MFS transporter permease subunit [Nocardiopsis sp. ATB16-24]